MQHELTTGKIRFLFLSDANEEIALELEFLEFVEEVQATEKACKNAGEDHFVFLRKVRESVQKQTGVRLNLGQVHEMTVRATQAFFQQRRQDADDFAATLGLPGSTDSIPSDSVPSN